MRIPQYLFDAVLYQGDATLVYAGVREVDGAPVVGKMVTGGARDLRVELALLQKLQGQGIVEALGEYDSSDGPVMVQRRFGDMSLAEALRDGPFEIRRALHVGLQLARVLTRIHAERVLHRDIKPANVLFDSKTDAIAVADFGIAIELPVNARSLPPGDLVGTPAYLAPEQTGRTREGVDTRSDLYAFGVTLYHMLTGDVPFGSTDLLELVSAHLSKVPESVRQRNPAVPEVLSDLVMKLLSKAPDQRYQSARGIAADLARCLETLTPDGTIPRFELGRSDLVRPRPVQRLFGREAEHATFQAAFDRAAAGTPTVALVAGREGSGRGEFVRAMLRATAISSPVAAGGWKSEGEKPLAGLSDALDALARELLLLDDIQLGAVRERLLEQLGQIGQVVIDIAPALGDVLGPQPELAPLGPAEARGRLQHAFRRLAAALGEEHVFVLSLANVEYADTASKLLIETLLDMPAGTRVLVVLSAREPEGFGALTARPNAVTVELGALSLEAMTQWTAALLDMPHDRAAELSFVLHEKSGGSPGLFASLLEHFIETGIIGRADGAFVWVLEDLRAAKAPPSAGALAAQRVRELKPEQRELLAAVACADDACDIAALSAMVAEDPAAISPRLTALEREGLIAATGKGGYAAAHEAIKKTALASVEAVQCRTMQGRLGVHLLRTLTPAELTKNAYRVVSALGGGQVELAGDERLKAAELNALAADQVTASMAYETAARFYGEAVRLLGDSGWTVERALTFRVEVGLARSLIMQQQQERAEAMLANLSERELDPREIGVVYPARADGFSSAQKRDRAIEVGLEGLARLGFPLNPEPSVQEAFGLLLQNEAVLSKTTVEEHLQKPYATDPSAMAAITIISTLAGPLSMAGRTVLYVLSLETSLQLNMRFGYTRFYASLLATHSLLLHSRLENYDGARQSYEACIAVQKARPAPEIDGRTFIASHYMIFPWFWPPKDAMEQLQRSIQLSIEAGDPLYAALSASASLTLSAMSGEPLDQLVARVDALAPMLRADSGIATNAANVKNVAGKMSRGEPIEQADLDLISNVSIGAGSARSNAMVNLGLALTVIGHDAQVRVWLEELRTTFTKFAAGQPHLVSLWLLDGLYAARDAQAGNAERLALAETMVASLQKLKAKAKSDNYEASIALLEAEIARAKGELERASGLYGRAASAARQRGYTHIAAFTMERRADLATQQGYEDEAALFVREAAIAYRRWSHNTKAAQLELAHPELKTLDQRVEGRGRKATVGQRPGSTAHATASRTAHATNGGAGRTAAGSTINESLDLATVLKVSQDISTQLHASGVVKAVLLGVGQNSGAERVVLILRANNEEVLYGEAEGGEYRDVHAPLTDGSPVPQSVLRVARRTAKPVIVIDAVSDASHANDPYVVATRCRSIAVIPIVQKGVLGGFVVLENRLVAGAFTPALIGLAQALVAQAAISLDNASLYENMEHRVRERTAALNARNAEMRLVFDNVSQGLVMTDREGRVSSEGSAILQRWFPEGVPNTLTGIFATEPLFDASWSQLIDGFLPPELCVDQLPKHLKRGEQIFEIGWQLILDDKGEMSRMLMVMSDITELLRQQEAEQEQKQMMALFERLSADRNGVIEFAKEAANIVREIERAENSNEVEKRLVHTLKGNCAFFGLSGISSLCHDLESAMINEERGLTPEERAEICTAWHTIDQRLGRFLDVNDNSTLQVRKLDFESALRSLVREGHPVAHDLELWKLEPLEARFQRIAEQAQALAQRLGKAPIKVAMEHANIRIPAETWSPLWASFVHAVRNAIDHGLEPAEDRAAVGKGIGSLRLRAYFAGPSLFFEFSDDGRGINWAKVREKARGVGIPSETHDDLVNALFSDGISTKEVADENSGRGVGMSALRDACVQMGAVISVDSVAGQGTTWRFEFPAHLAKLPRERRSSMMPSILPPN